MAPGYEKSFHKALQHYAAGQIAEAASLFKESAEKDDKDRVIADDLFAGLLSAQLDDDDAAVFYLEKVVTADQPLPDALMDKYVPGGYTLVPVTENATVEVPFGSLAAALTLAEVYQRSGRVEEAIGVLQQLVEAQGHPFLALSLCDLYAEVEDWEGVIDCAAGIVNDDDVTLKIRVLQAEALKARGLADAALEAYKDALRSKKRDPELLKEARYGRGQLYLSLGKRAQGRKDLEKLYAEDPHYRDVADLLAASA